jgi:phenylalanyl-tRNA synthetase beta chain
MKISLEWLKDYVDLQEPTGKLKEDLTMIGLVAESESESAGATVLDLEITSNRPDCLSHYGIAREIAALYGRQLRRVPAVRTLNLRRERVPFAIEIRDPGLCPRYAGLVMDGLRVGASPDWMQRRLEAAGMRPVNNIVDVSNYVLLEYGHPLHAFDFRLLRGGKIVVARAQRGQSFCTLDGIVRELDEEMLMINDSAGPVAIAGVMGGMNSEINENTETVLLECAYFHPMSVRRTSKKLGLSTEASYRFERGADWDGLRRATARAAYLLQKLAGGRLAGSLQDAYPQKLAPVQIELRRERAETLLGIKIEDDFIVSTLRKLHFKTARTGKGRWRVQCPTFRADIELEADLVEEVARFHGYQKIPTAYAAGVIAGTPSPVFRQEQMVRRILLGLGYSEAVNLTFADKEEFRLFPPREGEPVRILNPLTADMEFLRSSLIPGLVRSAKHNFNHDQRLVRLFELGKVFRSGAGVLAERSALGILGTGSGTEVNWRQPREDYDFFSLKGVLGALLQAMRGSSFRIEGRAGVPWLNPADASALIVAGEEVGLLGSLNPALAEEFKLKQPLFVAELDLGSLQRFIFTPVSFETPAKYPAVERDLSLIISKDITYEEIHAGILGLGMTELTRVQLMDVYEGQQVPEGQMSLLLRFAFQDREATLTVDRVQAFSDTIRNFLHDHFNAEFR